MKMDDDLMEGAVCGKPVRRGIGTREGELSLVTIPSNTQDDLNTHTRQCKDPVRSAIFFHPFPPQLKSSSFYFMFHDTQSR